MSRYYGLVMPKIFGTGVTKVESLRQTSSSRASGGENTITQTMTDGSSASFTVLNGQGLKSTEQSESTDGNGLRSNTVRLNSSAPDLVADVAFTVKDGVGVRSHGAVSETDENNVVSKKLTIKYTDGTSDSIVFSDAKAGVAALAKSLNDERAERQTGDNTLLEKLSAEEKKRGDNDTALRISIEDEAVARTSACALLQTGMTAEESARKEADTTLQGNISTETAERKAADESLQSQISANKAAVDTLNGTGEGSVSKAVADRIAEVVSDAPGDFDTLKEISDWISGHESDAGAMNTAIQANKAAIAAETARAETKESEIEKSLASEAERAAAKEAELEKSAGDNAAAIEAETAGRISGDTTLQTNIDTEAKRASNAEKTISNMVSSEVERATEKESELEDSISDNASAISEETARATAKESELQDAIDTLNADAKTEGSVAKAVADAKADTEANITDTVNGIVNTQVSKVIEERSSKSGVDTHSIKIPFVENRGVTYLHVLTTKGSDEMNGIIELYIGGNADSVVDSFKFTISSSGGAEALKQLLRADFSKHMAGLGITAAYACTTAYYADKQIWLKIVNAKSTPVYYAMANSFLTTPTWVMKTQTTEPANITTTLDLSTMQCGSKTA